MPSSGHQVLSTPLCLGPDTNWLGLPPVRSSDDQHGQSRELPTNELRERLSGLLSLNGETSPAPLEMKQIPVFFSLCVRAGVLPCGYLACTLKNVNVVDVPIS